MAAETRAPAREHAGGISPQDAWSEWKALCALARCSAGTRSHLRSFAASRFAALWRRCTGPKPGNAPAESPVTPHEVWHLFETHLAVRSTRAGKRYKDWLFARVEQSPDTPLQVIEGGAVLILRDVAREHLRREFPPAGTVSLHVPMQGKDSALLTLEDLLPGTADVEDETERREFLALAAGHARALFAAASHKQRVSLFAKEAGLSLAAPQVESAAGCRKTVLNRAYQRFMQNLAATLIAAYPDDDRESVLAITLMTLDEAKKAAFGWAGAEKRCADLFKEAGGIVREAENHLT